MAVADYTSVVQSLYVAYFGRPADTFGLENFAKQLDALGAPKTVAELNVAAQTNPALKTLVNSFSGSAEAAALYGTGDAVAFVSSIYQNLLNRAPDFEGLKFWVNAINTGALTRGNASLAIAAATQSNTSAQGVLDAQLINNKIAVASAFTTSIDTGEELGAYSGAAAAAAARGVLAQVTPTTTVAAFQPVVDAALVKLVDISNPGVTNNLGITTDAFTGTSGKDVFNAQSANPLTGTDATTLGAFDVIDGGAGRDTLNIYSKTGINVAQVGTVNNVEVINIFNSDAAAANQFGGAAGVNAAKFVGATEIWQASFANDVTNLGATQTAGFRGTTNDAINVSAASASASVALDQVSGVTTTNVLDVNVSGASLASVNLTGTLVKADEAVADAAAATLDITAGKDVTAVAVNSNVNTIVTLTKGAGSTKEIGALNAAASTGNIKFVGAATVNTVTTGAGADDVSVATATVAAASGVTAVTAAVNTGAGNDKIAVATTGAGLTTVDAGAGDDKVELTARSSGKLTVNLGDGVDTFTSTVAINATDVINAGAGNDTLSLALVGSANIGAFSGFDLFDAAALGTKTLDVDILASKNTVTEFVASADVGGAAVLTNVGAGVGFRATGDLGTTNSIELTQKTAGLLTITLDADETGSADLPAESAAAKVSSSNATSIKAVFDTAFLANIDSEVTAGDNVATLNITANKATTVEVVSGGTNASNVLNFTGAEATTLTVTGAGKLDIGTTVAVKLATIDASASTGGLIVSTLDVKDGGTIKLGTGTDIVTVDATSVAAGVESVTNFEKTAAAAVGTDVDAAKAATDVADVLSFGATHAVAADATVAGVGAVKNGVLAFSGAGPADLAAAITAATGATAATQVVAFEFVGNTYVVEDGGSVVKLVGVTGVTNLGEVGTTDTFFIV